MSGLAGLASSELDLRSEDGRSTDGTGETLARARSTGRAQTPRGVLDRFLTNSAIRNEKSIAIVRMVVAGLLLIQTLVFGETLQPRWWVAVVVTTLALSLSAWQLLTLAPSSRILARLYLSVTVDAVLVFSGMVSWVIWPPATYAGVLSRVEMPLLTILMVAAGYRLSRRVAIVGAGLAFVLGAALVVLDFVRNDAGIYYSAPELFIAGALGIGAALMGYFLAARTKQLIYEGADASVRAERARHRLGIYVSEELASDMIDQADLAMGGVKQPVAVLFSDLRGFTQYAEQIPPERLVSELNDYLDVMVEVIQHEGGFVDKFIGDSIMAVFSVPTPREDDALRALRTAKRMQEELARHNADREGRGLPPLRQGIGVHYGFGVVGNIGTERKAQFTVMGDVVNVASRLESATKSEAVAVLVSASVVERARDTPDAHGLPEVESHGRLSVPGREGELEVFVLAAGRDV